MTAANQQGPSGIIAEVPRPKLRVPARRPRLDHQRLARRGKVWQRRKLNYGDLGLFLFSLGIFLAAAYFLAFEFKLVLGDALSRTYAAFTTVYGAHPHLGSIGFIWPPILTVAQLPLVLYKPLVFYGFSGMIVTAVFGAGSVLVLERLYRHLGFGLWHRAALALMFIFNPFILYYAANGMSEIVFVFFFEAALVFFVVWSKAMEWRYVTLIAVAVALSFYARYDGMGLALAMFGAIALSIRVSDEGAATRSEGTLLAYTSVVAYSIAIWVFLNWLIMHDPLYFYRSEYSNLYLTQLMKDTPEVVALRESWQATGTYAIEKMYRLAPIFVFLVPITALLGLVLRKRALFLLVLVSLSVPAFQVYMYRQGTTFGFDRFYITVVPAAFILYSVLVGAARGMHWSIKGAITSLLLIGLLASTLATGYRMYEEGTSNYEGTALQAALNWREVNNYAVDLEVADYIRSNVRGRNVLADSTYADRIVLFTQDPKLFIHTSDPDFKDILQDPAGKAGYILALSPESIGFNAIRDQYPLLWDQGTDFTRLAKDFGRYRLYEVLRPERGR